MYGRGFRMENRPYFAHEALCLDSFFLINRLPSQEEFLNQAS